MFNREKIKDLEFKVDVLAKENERLRQQIWEVSGDLTRLMDYLLVRFVNVNERRVQAVIKSKPE